MPGQIVLQWTVDVTNTPLSAVAASARLAAVDLYVDDETDPVLGQLFGLTVDSDVTDEPDASTSRRTLTLNMDAQNLPTAPPPFPCHPRTSMPPVLPYPLRSTKTLPGSFFVTNGSMVVPTTATQLPSLNVGDSFQFLSQQGVFYEVASVTETTVGLTAPYTGKTGNTEAFKEVAAPVALDRLAIFSTSDLDTNGVATSPAIPAGVGARTVEIQYNDSTGAGPFEAEAELTGKRPAAFVFEAPPGIDVAEIVAMTIDGVGGFENNVGQLTLVGLSSALPDVLSNRTPEDFLELTDEAQLLIDRALAYMPPSYYALAGQGTSAPQLEGEFIVTTGATDVPTTEDQTAVLAAGNTLSFAAQPRKVYTIAAVTPKIVKLTEAYTGLDDNFTGALAAGKNPSAGTKGNVGSSVIMKRTSATRVSPAMTSVPTNAQLSAPLGQFVETATAAPPDNPPLTPHTIPAPTILSGMFTRQLQLALAGVPVTPATIAFA